MVGRPTRRCLVVTCPESASKKDAIQKKCKLKLNGRGNAAVTTLRRGAR